MLRILSRSRHRLFQHKDVSSCARTALRDLKLRPSLRSLHLSSMDPVQISDDRRTITLRFADGRTKQQAFAPTPKISREKLQVGLASLLSGEENDHASFATAGWELDTQGDAIHRHLAFSSAESLDKAVELIMQAAEEMNHHPHIARGDMINDNHPLTVTCTTHQPRGLSGKDIRLATKISQLWDELAPNQKWESRTTAKDQASQVNAERSRLIRINREAITEALNGCGCGKGKLA